MKTQTSNVNDSIKPTRQTTPVQILVAASVSAIVLSVLYPLACNRLLPTPDATNSKEWFFDTLRMATPNLISAGGIGAIGGSLLVRGGKMWAQLAPGIKTPATPDGEGIGANSAASTDLPDTQPANDSVTKTP